jgi:hypothetical protein
MAKKRVTLWMEFLLNSSRLPIYKARKRQNAFEFSLSPVALATTTTTTTKKRESNIKLQDLVFCSLYHN